MKKIFNKPIFAFILGFILFSSISSVVAGVIIASNVGFTPIDDTWTVDNTKLAIDSLYQNYSNITEPKIADTRSYSLENTNTCTVTDMKVDSAYLCIVNARSYSGVLSVSNAQVLLNQENGGYLDYKYTTYRAYIIPTSSSVTFTVSNTRGIGVVCYQIISGD